MDRIPVRELNQHTSAVLARVEHGEALEVTVNGRPVARLMPVEADDTHELQDLVARGRIVPATAARGLIPMPAGEIDHHTDSAAIISEMREERL
ncbi:hypothetical protein Lesp02_51130 [Lentzea sp. NBRC 105346]|uniref:type II toxin-antitoxin system Phd/YefM family antitoxin n=1 Tax=Lentzea sp. NBRC 105346 TaxID=3032205 RepID=UPI0024A4B439|nr:type II toxin-antitoxin system prevent-host-death family antitoxin [Lentzea sp. NBRC 105346]GLZ32925.1 hypothetical protein Lesp02_51130 [Lentzea sp. NBRC 105346]